MSEFPKPLLLGHRGAAGEAPENTWPAFETARASGAHGFEVDVLLTRDRAPVCVHDLTLQRIAGGHGAIQSMNLSDISKLDVGGHFHPRYAGERIPRFEDVLSEYGKDMILDVEIKGYSPFSEGIEEVVVKLLRERDLLDTVIISSFNPVILKRVKALAPDLRIGSNYISDTLLQLRRIWFAPFLKPYSKHPQPGQVDEAYIKRQHKRGIKVIPWGVNDPEEIRRLFDLGVDGIISDFPGRLVKLMESGK
jgi:glycerophosphoryl diester phosphodiesterase